MARAAKGFSHKRVTTESVTIKGFLSEDGEQITYVEDDQEKVASVKEYLQKFAGDEVEFKIGIKQEDNLSDDE